ncbi:MAG TPA: polysaccharide biosynthesis/export family protein [Candidatus Acidoferrum sp.]|nr:polysaccharide biosynthesis/export family protein [Candidatus Acidoferrum sp.]
MKKSICLRSLLLCSVLALGVSGLTGCDTPQYYDAGHSPAYTSPKQSSAQNAYDTFDNWSTPTSSGTSAQQQTILRQGDTVKITFPGSANLDQTAQIRLDGKISMPLVGEVQAAGMTPSELEQTLVKLYAPQISSSDVTVALVSSSFPVYVTGCVLSPGRVLSSQPLTALEAVMEAGGFDYSRANLRNVHVIRRQNASSQSYVLNLKSVLDGDEKNDFYLQPNDIVYVPEKFSWF